MVYIQNAHVDLRRIWTHDGFPHFENCLLYLNSVCEKNKNIYIKVVDSLILSDFDLLHQKKKKAMLTNNFIKINLQDSDKIIKFDDTWYGMYAGHAGAINREPNKNFNCFINRMDPIRQSWAYQLIRRKLFDQGYISFNMDISRHQQANFLKVEPTDTPMDIFENQFTKYCAIFDKEHEILKPIVPYRNFESTLLSQVVIDSKFSIILESAHTNSNFITFSEKIFRCLKLPRPWVMHAQQGAIDYLRRMGFDVIDDIVNHDYDNLDFSVDRQVAILDQCEQLLTLDIKTCMPRLEQAANHNVNLLNQFYSQWHQNIDKCFAKAEELSK